MSTIRDVAKLAGVSTATVSHVINNSHTVRPDTRQQVLAAIERLNYRPSAIARSLTTSVTRSIGVMVADITNPFFAAIVRGIGDRLEAHGYNLIVCNTDEQANREARYLELLLARRVDGMIIAPTGVRLAGLSTQGHPAATAAAILWAARFTLGSRPKRSARLTNSSVV